MTTSSFSLSVAGCALAVALVAAPQAMADIVTNGGFESTIDVGTTNLSGLQPASWTVTAPDLYTFDSCGSNLTPTHSGNCVMEFGSTSSATLAQTLSTMPGTAYTISFWLTEDRSNQYAPSDMFSIAFGSSALSTFSNFGPLSYTQYTYTATATGTATTLTFSAYDVPALIGLDDVSVDPVTSSIPEPPAFALLASAVAGLVFLRLHRHRA